MSNVTLSMPCYRTGARVITFLPVFPWRVTINARRKEKLELSHRKNIYARRKEMHREILYFNAMEEKRKFHELFLSSLECFKMNEKKFYELILSSLECSKKTNDKAEQSTATAE